MTRASILRSSHISRSAGWGGRTTSPGSWCSYVVVAPPTSPARRSRLTGALPAAAERRKSAAAWLFHPSLLGALAAVGRPLARHRQPDYRTRRATVCTSSQLRTSAVHAVRGLATQKINRQQAPEREAGRRSDRLKRECALRTGLGALAGAVFQTFGYPLLLDIDDTVGIELVHLRADFRA